MPAGTAHRLTLLEEPYLCFGFGQRSRNPKHGLYLFGPVKEQNNPTEIRCGVIGTSAGIRAYRTWVERISRPIPAPTDSTSSVVYPGFRELFHCTWPTAPVIEIPILAAEISAALHGGDRYSAIHSTVSIFSDRINAFLRDDDRRVDIWFVIIPDEVFELGRPQSRVPHSQRSELSQPMTARLAKRLMREPSLFPEDMRAAEPFLYQRDFHHQLKARLIRSRAITQVIRESTLGTDESGASKRRMQDPASIAWNLSVSSFYKAGGRPWRLSNIRDGVCYVGLIFKRLENGPDPSFACCGAQMFLTNGEGMVFKATGSFYSPELREFHLDKEQAAALIARAIAAYQAGLGRAPAEVFIHGRTRFSDDEWAGFQSAAPRGTSVCGIRITRNDEFKLFRPGRMPVVRGTVAIESNRLAYLWTSGFFPDLETYPGWEVPNPLRVESCRGDASMFTVVSDVLQLTKLNFNSCIYGDGLPVTLRFAESVAEILTAAPPQDITEAPLPFRHYI